MNRPLVDGRKLWICDSVNLGRVLEEVVFSTNPPGNWARTEEGSTAVINNANSVWNFLKLIEYVAIHRSESPFLIAGPFLES
ncbi:MAG: hypothetical protein HY695_20465 [Deltaproteobacteria bacterium]|nr:hypothetical protein [Deltaproteobacteria bacterium]